MYYIQVTTEGHNRAADRSQDFDFELILSDSENVTMKPDDVATYSSISIYIFHLRKC